MWPPEMNAGADKASGSGYRRSWPLENRRESSQSTCSASCCRRQPANRRALCCSLRAISLRAAAQRRRMGAILSRRSIRDFKFTFIGHIYRQILTISTWFSLAEGGRSNFSTRFWRS